MEWRSPGWMVAMALMLGATGLALAQPPQKPVAKAGARSKPAKMPAAQMPSPAHEGVVGALGKGYVELVVSAKEIRLWLRDARGAAIEPHGREARAALTVEGKPVRTLELAPRGDHLVASADLDGALRVTVMAAVKIDGRIHRARLYWGLLNNKNINDADALDGLSL